MVATRASTKFVRDQAGLTVVFALLLILINSCVGIVISIHLWVCKCM